MWVQACGRVKSGQTSLPSAFTRAAPLSYADDILDRAAVSGAAQSPPDQITTGVVRLAAVMATAGPFNTSYSVIAILLIHIAKELHGGI